MKKARTQSTRTRSRAGKAGAGGKKVRLRPANPFDLIRLIARSQNDPRKALAELVQNSLDAGARNITVTRQRRMKEVAISVSDDGGGVFPGMPREEALERIATNIGYSFKRDLSPAERREQMTLGKYGIGILGFWAVGKELEMRTRVDGSEVWALRLVRDRATAEVYRIPERRISFPGDTWTEIWIRSVHPGASRQLAGRRLGDYLGSELRGQLLERTARLRIVDRIARGKALKDFVVRPKRFHGRRIQEVDRIAVPSFPDARLELYLAEATAEHPGRVALTCGGTVVCEDVSAAEECGMARPPWNLGCLEGVVEFPELDVAPATRRGFSPGPAADALFRALGAVEPLLLELIEKERQRLRTEEDRSVAREIRKVFLPLTRALPQYDFFEVRSRRGSEADSQPAAGAQLGQTGETKEGGDSDPDEGATSETVEDAGIPEPDAEILPSGPLATVRISPRRCRMLPGATRKLRGAGMDESGRLVTTELEYSWAIREGSGSLSADGPEATFTAPEEPGSVKVFLQAMQGEWVAWAEAEIEVVEQLSREQRDAGIPEPKRVYDPSGDWRSRVNGRRWEYNSAHPDYVAVQDETRRRLRYLVHLFAKEIVLRNYGEPGDERLLEKMVEVLTHIQAKG